MSQLISKHMTKVDLEDYLAQTMVLVEGGIFLMGSDEYDDEKPIHEVTLGGYYLCKYPVTQALYEVVMDENPSCFEGDNRPVEQVSWYETIHFCNRLSELMDKQPCYEVNGEDVVWLEGAKGYRLPTEAEWEYAARGGRYNRDNYRFAGGNMLKEVGWYDENSHGESKPVGLKKPNQLGLYDLSGNILEWCWDLYRNYLADTKFRGNRMRRVLRGGSWSSYDDYSRVPYRNYNCLPDLWDDNIGFRLVLPV